MKTLANMLQSPTELSIKKKIKKNKLEMKVLCVSRDNWRLTADKTSHVKQNRNEERMFDIQIMNLGETQSSVSLNSPAMFVFLN